MFNSEYAPLVDKTDKNSSKCKFIRYLSILLLFAIGAVLCYYLSSPQSLQNHLFLNELPSYPTQEEIDEYRSKTVVIEYDLKDLPESADVDDAALREFHDNLIMQHGYNSVDYNVHFLAMDDDEDTELEADEAPVRFRCGTVTANSTKPGFMEINCDSSKYGSAGMVITGCVSYEVLREGGARWGESGRGDSDCYTMAMDKGTQLSARCCKALGKDTLTTTYNDFNGDAENAFCLTKYCGSDYTAMGCGATNGDYTSTLSGVKRIEHDYTGVTGCTTQRSTAGKLSIAPYCGILENKNPIICRTEYGWAEPLGNSPKYVSRIRCPTGTKMTDCDNQIKAEINECSGTDEDLGASYGGYIKALQCAAVGDSPNIMAVATCCKIG